MLQRHRCVRAYCDQCAEPLAGPDGQPEHYRSETTAWDAALTQGWQEGPGGAWWCSACAPVLTCEAQGHEFTDWQSGQRGGAYRYCRRCCLFERHHAAVGLVGAS